MNPHPYNLLRRTLAVLATIAGFASIPVHAQATSTGSMSTNPKADGTGTPTKVCDTWTSLTLTPSGLQVNGCNAAPSGAVAASGTFTLNGAAQIDAAQNQYLWYTVSRSGSSTAGAVTLSLTSDGGCTLSPASVSFTDGSSGSANVQYFGVIAPKDATGKIYNTTCNVAITQQSPALSLANSPLAVQVINGPGTVPGSGTGTPAGCPAIPTGSYANFPIHFQGSDFPYMSSGQIGYTTLPTYSQLSGGAAIGSSADVATAITTGSTNGTVEISINKCPGVIDKTGQYAGGATGGKCYKSIQADQSAHWLTWFEFPGTDPTATDNLATTYGICEAYASKGPWYVNIRYTFAGTGTTNYAFQYQWDSFTP